MKFPRTIYALQHNITKKMYIGSTTDLERRYSDHLYALRAGKHTVPDMQQDFIDYGENYSLFVLEVIERHCERKKEYEWMKKYKTYIKGIGYNYRDNYFRRRPGMIVPLRNGLPEEFPK